MTNFDDAPSQPHTNPGVEDEPGPPRSSMTSLRRAKSPGSQTVKSLKSKRSLRQVPPQHQGADPQSTLTPIQRFRMSVRKVMHLTKTTSYLSGKGPGAEPGVDVHKDSAFSNYGHIRQNCLIEVVDYSSVRSRFGRMTNREFISFLDDPAASEREHWAKVRWINVGGISWDVVRALALKYGASDSYPSARTIFTARLRSPPVITGGFTSRPGETPFWRRLLQETPFHPRSQPRAQQRRGRRTQSLGTNRSPIITRTTRRVGRQGRDSTQVLVRRYPSLLWVRVKTLQQVEVAPQVWNDRTWGIRRRECRCEKAYDL